MIELDAVIKKIEFIQGSSSGAMSNSYLYIETPDGKFRFTLSRETMENDVIANVISKHEETEKITKTSEAIRLLDEFAANGIEMTSMATQFKTLINKLDKFVREVS